MRARLAVATDDLAGAATADAFLALAAFGGGDLGEVGGFEAGRAGFEGGCALLHDGGRLGWHGRFGCGG